VEGWRVLRIEPARVALGRDDRVMELSTRPQTGP
jgi:hypothetical protein